MAVRTYRLGAGQDGNFAALFEADQTAANRTDGWTVGKLAALQMAEFDAGTKQTTAAFSTFAKPGSFLTGTTANALKIPAALLGTFAATAWTFSSVMRATTASSQAGRMRLRVFKATDAAGTTGVVELTSATQIGLTSGGLTTTADSFSTVTWSPGTTIRLNNEFLFFVIAWEVTTASGSNSGDVVLRTGQASAGTRVVTPDFAAATLYLGAVALPVTFAKAVAGQIIPASAYAAQVLTDGPRAYWRMGESAAPIVDSINAINFDSGAIGGTTALAQPSLLGSEAANKSIQFTNGWLTRGTHAALDVRDVFTIEAWIKLNTTSNSASQSIFSNWSGGQYLRLSSSNQLQLLSSFTQLICTSTAAIGDLNAHHVVATKNGSTVKLYIDGVDVTGTVSNYTFASAPTWLAIGSGVEGNENAYMTMDEVALYPTALTPTQVSNHYALGSTGPVAQTYYGILARPITYGAAVAARRTTFSGLVVPLVFTKAVQGVRKTFGTVALPVIFQKAVAGQRTSFGVLARPTVFTKAVAGQKQTFGILARPITFTKAVAGVSTAGAQTYFGILARPSSFTAVTQGQRKTFGVVAVPVVFGKAVQGSRKTFSVVAAPLVFGKAVTGQRKTFGTVALPAVFTKDVRGQRQTFGALARPIAFTKAVAGIATVPAVTHYGVVARPTTFTAVTQARRTVFGTLARPIVFTASVNGQLRIEGVTINLADMLYLGSQPVSKVYAGTTQVWP